MPFSVDPDIETTVTVISKFDVRRKLEGDKDIEVDTAIRPNKLYMDRSTSLFLNINAGVLIGAFIPVLFVWIKKNYICLHTFLQALYI